MFLKRGDKMASLYIDGNDPLEGKMMMQEKEKKIS